MFARGQPAGKNIHLFATFQRIHDEVAIEYVRCLVSKIFMYDLIPSEFVSVYMLQFFLSIGLLLSFVQVTIVLNIGWA